MKMKKTAMKMKKDSAVMMKKAAMKMKKASAMKMKMKNNKQMGLLQKVFSSGAGKLIKDVGGVLDDLTTSKEEKLAAQQKIKNLIYNHELELQKQVSSRWEADMKSDSWLSKNVTPLVLIFLVI